MNRNKEWYLNGEFKNKDRYIIEFVKEVIFV